MAVFEINHPLVRHKLSYMREAEIGTKHFRELTAEIGSILCYEATRDLETEPIEIQGWAGSVQVERIKGKKITIVPILRAGLGMMAGVLEMMPCAKVSVIGLARNEETLEPHGYYQNFTSNVPDRTALIIDPMLATGGSLIATIEALKEAGCQRIKGIFMVAAPEGLKRLEETHPDVDLYVAAIDERLNDVGYILPGLGDAGDKIFGTK